MSVHECNMCVFLLHGPVAEGPYGEVVKLQTMRCLFEAYEHVLSLLENVFTPMFCHSDEVSVRSPVETAELFIVSDATKLHLQKLLFQSLSPVIRTRRATDQ